MKNAQFSRHASRRSVTSLLIVAHLLRSFRTTSIMKPVSWIPPISSPAPIHQSSASRFGYIPPRNQSSSSGGLCRWYLESVFRQSMHIFLADHAGDLCIPWKPRRLCSGRRPQKGGAPESMPKLQDGSVHSRNTQIGCAL